MTEEQKDKETLTAEEAAETAQKAQQTNDTTAQEEHPADDAGGEDGASDTELTPEQRLAQAEAQIAELKTQALYKQAEFDNYRKRTLKEKAELILNGAEKTVVAFLPVLDDFERALQNMEKAEDVASVREGVELIFQKFNKTLSGLGVEPIDTKDADFDVDVHEAIAQIPAPADELKGKVIDCVQTGYKLNDKVIRHAKVAVGV